MADEKRELTPAEKVDRQMVELNSQLEAKLEEMKVEEMDANVIKSIFNQAAGGAVVNCLTLDVFFDKVAKKIGIAKANKMLVDSINETIVMTGNKAAAAETEESK